jgi:hypothetical protein
VFDFVEKCRFDERSRAWRRTDLFTLLVEIHSALVVRGLQLDPAVVGPRLETFYSEVAKLYDTRGGTTEGETANVEADVMRYLKAATKATNDKYARVDRAEIVGKILASTLVQPAKPASRPVRKRGKPA